MRKPRERMQVVYLRLPVAVVEHADELVAKAKSDPVLGVMGIDRSTVLRSAVEDGLGVKASACPHCGHGGGKAPT